MFRVNTAVRLFNENPNLSKYIPEQSLDNAIVKYVKNNDLIQKVASRKDGIEVTGTFKNGKAISTDIDSAKGNIHYDYAPDNAGLPENFQVNKTITITTADGDKLVRHFKKDGNVQDVLITDRAPVKTGRFDAYFKELLAKIKQGDR